MTREAIFAAIEKERARQEELWGDGFDRLNTVNDWVSYIVRYVAEGAYDGREHKFSAQRFREHLLKTATLIVAALEQESFAPRHYDGTGRVK